MNNDEYMKYEQAIGRYNRDGDDIKKSVIEFAIDDNGIVTSNHVYIGNVKNNTPDKKSSIEDSLERHQNKFNISQKKGNIRFSVIHLKNVISLMMEKINRDHCDA